MKKHSLIYIISFIVYLLLVIWILLLKMEFIPEITNPNRAYNLVLFKGVFHHRRIDSDFINNIIIFIPYGLFIGNTSFSLLDKLLLPALTSILIEFLQYYFRIGVGDINDFIANTAGAIFGLIFFYIMRAFFRRIKRLFKKDKKKRGR